MNSNSQTGLPLLKGGLYTNLIGIRRSKMLGIGTMPVSRNKYIGLVGNIVALHHEVREFSYCFTDCRR